MRTKSVSMLKYFGFLLLVILSFDALAQKEKKVTGRVFPAGMQTPMREVKVQIQGNDSLFVFTDDSGSFSIEVKSFPVKLIFSKMTYRNQVIKIKKAIDISVYMMPGIN